MTCSLLEQSLMKMGIQEVKKQIPGCEMKDPVLKYHVLNSNVQDVLENTKYIYGEV